MLELDRLHKNIVAIHNTATMLTSTLNIGYIPKTLMPYREAFEDINKVTSLISSLQKDIVFYKMQKHYRILNQKPKNIVKKNFT